MTDLKKWVETQILNGVPEEQLPFVKRTNVSRNARPNYHRQSSRELTDEEKNILEANWKKSGEFKLDLEKIKTPEGSRWWDFTFPSDGGWTEWEIKLKMSREDYERNNWPQTKFMQKERWSNQDWWQLMDHALSKENYLPVEW